MLRSGSHNKRKNREDSLVKRRSREDKYIFSSFHSGAKVWMVGHNLDKPSHAVFLKITILFIFGLDVRRAFLDHSKLRDIDTLKFGKISYLHERPFSGKIRKFCWYSGMGSESFIFSWLTFEIAKYSLWTALTNHITPNICRGLTEMSKLLYQTHNITIEVNNCENTLQKLF